jgi:hypothetical protein
VSALPPLPTLTQVRERLDAIFPGNFPDRTPLVGEMAIRAVFVFLYGGYIEGTERFLRPSTIIRFSLEQAALTSDADRLTWAASCQAPGHIPRGKSWYADNSRETLRDDLIRNRAMPIGLVVKRQGVPPSSPAPIYAMSEAFTALFDPALQDEALEQAIFEWQEHHLDPMTLKRMKLLAGGVSAKEGQVTVLLPTSGKTLRLAAGEASTITKDVCEVMSTWLLSKPVVIHVSISDQKTFPELKGASDAVGLKFDPSADLPDVVMVDVGLKKGMTVVFVEVVHSDGPITELRAQALLHIAAQAGIPPEAVTLITAFEDRGAPAFKKRVSELARGSWAWFRSEPYLFFKLDTSPPPKIT